jgi:hypothetical protein
MIESDANRHAVSAVMLAAFAFGLALTPPATAQNTENSVGLLLRWVDTKPDQSLANFVVFLGFHNGQFDSYDLGQPVDPLVAEWIPRGFNPATDLIEAFETRFAGAKGAWIWNPNPDTLSFPGPSTQPWVAVADVDPQRHRFLSYLSRLTPANDAFIANEDPFQIEVFDAQGRFRGPLYVDVYGNQVIDAGLCGNDEARLTGLDVALYEEQLCQSGEGHAQLHPGLNGSYRNPSGIPQRILGGETYYLNPGQTHFRRYGEIGADFSRPGHKLGRLIVSRWTATGNWSGSWYSPERSGEGFNVEVLEPDAGNQRARILVYWYTYTPDGSGEQVWLTGVGEFDADNGLAANVPLHYTEGGRFASPLNPGLVERRPWGSIRIRFEWSSCTDGRVHWFPDDPAWPTGDYAIRRLSPQIEGLGWVCRPGDAQLVLPED